MIAPADPAPSPWTKPAGAVVSAPKIAFLKDTVCRLQGSVLACQPTMPAAQVMQALQQLIDIVMQLRSPMGGWPADLEQTPENLAAYVSEETWELLDALAQAPLGPTPEPPPEALVLVPVSELIPHLLWLLASSNYEVMRLLEGVRSRIYTTDTQFALGVVRLVPVLSLTLGDHSYSLDLVTQAALDSTLFIADSHLIKLVENDLDDQPMTVAQMLDHLNRAISQTKPPLSPLLQSGWQTQALSPFQSWAAGHLQLRLYLATMGERQPAAEQKATVAAPGNTPTAPAQNGNGDGQPPPTGFTLDDFAEVLEDHPPKSNPGVLGDWLTFTDEGWVQDFLNSCAGEIMLQHLPELKSGADMTPAARELACIQQVYAATTLVQGDQALSKHTFVHEPALVADVWLRLRWYLAHCSERVMQLMGGLSCRILNPGRGWQQGYLYLRPVMSLKVQAAASAGADQRLWMLDLGHGRILPTHPLVLPADAVIAVVDSRDWASPLTVRDLTALIDRDVTDYAPAIAALSQGGTPIHLHRLESEEGRQSGHLTLDWGFTLQAAL